MKLFLLALALTGWFSANAQQATPSMQPVNPAQSIAIAGKTVFRTVPPGETHTSVINVSGYEQSLIDGLKEDLLAYEGKVSEVTFVESTRRLLITYNEFMQLSDLLAACERWRISCVIPRNPSAIPEEK